MNLNKALKLFGKILLGIFLFFTLIALATIARVDRSPIQEQDFYKQTFQELETKKFPSSMGENWLAGWGKANMTPSEPVALVGYAPRGKYEFVQDSSFVKSILLSNGKQQIAWLNYELLIVHPYLAKAVEEGLKSQFPDLDQLIFTATHTHSGMGGYIPGPLGKFALGGFQQTTVDLMVAKSLEALQNAEKKLDTVSISFRKADAAELVANRFVKDGPTDPFVRQLIFSKKGGEKATLLTYSAHATCLSSKFMGLSGDYPYYLMQEMEANNFDFALFAAGTVGSHRPLPLGNSPELIRQYALSLDSLNRMKMVGFSTDHLALIESGRLDLKLREPHLRISDNLRIRPWLFDYLMGDTNPHLDITRIGNTLLIASSGEISGVFYEKWEKLANQKGLNLIITTFNGGYIGYITPDDLYDEHYHEVRETNWYGPGNGRYFDELISRIIELEKP
ncbi:neutral/alkaline non-lysosomal ceramidase N-terminal domain-containing protein [Algoriphagus sp. CAU 1675]|uniref:neutral/alkaline non-lysosomal ceramidase N-terminal domain-containing protein n=1 Tax=Algoriphagus sp. CAU 1675 TaxID=3032597 RepID=UPI0023DCA2AB|nr:neutral/alkaline non-lysosomal ceramidase N-terminal domain-containing protein [Algoriphagus sp. CAU 1675]MDF2158792.1 neutral/alkaline non-lysosomal ceramidase N-terminal domain-containing protein [Algoriphagus sp. CAU 1675]